MQVCFSPPTTATSGTTYYTSLAKASPLKRIQLVVTVRQQKHRVLRGPTGILKRIMLEVDFHLAVLAWGNIKVFAGHRSY